FVQANRSHVRNNRVRRQREKNVSQRPKAYNPVSAVARERGNADIQKHDEKRRIENRLLEYRIELEDDDKLNDDEIDKRVESERERLLSRMQANEEADKNRRKDRDQRKNAPPSPSGEDTSQRRVRPLENPNVKKAIEILIAIEADTIAMIIETEVVEIEADKIQDTMIEDIHVKEKAPTLMSMPKSKSEKTSDRHVEGQAFDRELQEEKKKLRLEEEEKKKKVEGKAQRKLERQKKREEKAARKEERKKQKKERGRSKRSRRRSPSSSSRSSSSGSSRSSSYSSSSRSRSYSSASRSSPSSRSSSSRRSGKDRRGGKKDRKVDRKRSRSRSKSSNRSHIRSNSSGSRSRNGGKKSDRKRSKRSESPPKAGAVELKQPPAYSKDDEKRSSKSRSPNVERRHKGRAAGADNENANETKAAATSKKDSKTKPRRILARLEVVLRGVEVVLPADLGLEVRPGLDPVLARIEGDSNKY
ncbi:MAG: hypothetical protein SGILL_003372, partial [Bacillariaceae sp.]